MTRRTTLVGLASVLVGCGAKEPEKRYSMEGEIKSIDPKGKTASINAGKIEGFMEAMTMDYAVKPDAELGKLHVGDRIQATVVAPKDSAFYVTDVKVLPKQ